MYMMLFCSVLKLSILELHLKTIRDLLVPLPARARRKSRSDADKCCTIYEDRDGNYHVSNLTVVEISGLEDVLDHLNQAIGKRYILRRQIMFFVKKSSQAV